MNKTIYISLVIVCAHLFSFVVLLVLGSYIFEGEKSISIGLVWFYSIPAFVIFGVIIGILSYRWYSNRDGLLNQCVSLIGVSIAIAAISPVVTFTLL